MILLAIVLLVMTIISGKIILKKLECIEQSQRESIQGELLGFFLFYTMFIIMFFTSII